jgi:hypothetical protein
MPVGARMTVVRTPAGLVLHAPVALDDADAAELAALGPVTTIVAPNLFHYRFVPDARRRFPDARVLAAPGLRRKRPELPVDAELDAAPAPGLEQLPIAGIPALGEVAFFHVPSRTLLLTDLVFHFPDAGSLLLRLYLRSRAPRVTPLIRALVRDRRALAASRDALLGWDPARAVVAHGEIVTRDARESLRAALAWV